MGNRQSQNEELKHMQQINRNDQLYIFGTNNEGNGEILIFDAQKEQFFEATPPKGMKIIDYMGIVKVSNHLIYLCGGINKQKNKISDDLIEYNPITNSFCYLNRMKNSRYTHCLTYKSSKLYAIGGRTYGEGMNGLLASCEVYDFTERQWKEIAPLSLPRCTFFTFQYKEQLYVCGGFNGNKRRTDQIERYNEVLDKWDIIDMKLNRGIECGSLHVLENSSDEFVIFGGNIKDGGTNECWKFNLKKNTCDQIGQMISKRVLQKSILTSKNQIYILGGDRDEKGDMKQGQNIKLEQKNINEDIIKNNNISNFQKNEENVFQKILKQIENQEKQIKSLNLGKEIHINMDQQVQIQKGDIQKRNVLAQQVINNSNNLIVDKQTIEKSSFSSYGLKFERSYACEQDDLFSKRSYQNWKNYSQAHEIQIVKSSCLDIQYEKQYKQKIPNSYLNQYIDQNLSFDKSQLLEINQQSNPNFDNKLSNGKNQQIYERYQSIQNPQHIKSNSFGYHANNLLKNLFYGNSHEQNNEINISHNMSLEEVQIPHHKLFNNQHNNSMEIEDDSIFLQDNVENKHQRAVSISLNNNILSQLIQGCQDNLGDKQNRAQSSSIESDDLMAQIQNDHHLLLNTFIDNKNNLPIQNNQQSPFCSRFYLFGTSENQDFITEIDVLKQDIRKKVRPKKLRLLSYRSGVRFEESESLFICGGVNDEMTKISNSVYMYFPNEDRVELLKPMNSRRYTFCCVKKGNYVYVLGGRSYGSDEAAIMSKCERYNITTKEWEMIASMKYRRCSFMASCVENKLYVAGGYGGSMTRQSSFECYHEEENRWELMGIELIEPIEASTLLNIATHDQKKILILGGRSTKDDSEKIYSYDIKHGFDAFQGTLCGTMQSKRCLHKQIPLNHDSTTFLMLGGFTKGQRICAYSFNPNLNQVRCENKEFQSLINKLDTFLFKDLQSKDFTLRRNLLL